MDNNKKVVNLETEARPVFDEKFEERLKSLNVLDELPEKARSVLMSMAAPSWQFDPDTGERLGSSEFEDLLNSDGDEDDLRDRLQQEGWRRYGRSPQIATAVEGLKGRLCGRGFGVFSRIFEILEVIEEIDEDYRNRLYAFLPKHVGRSIIEGELFYMFTCHDDGFIEIDWQKPTAIYGSEIKGGIIFHPQKSFMPLVYSIKIGENEYAHVPSIYVARDPKLLNIARTVDGFDNELLNFSRSRKAKFKKLGGFFRFIVAWDKGLMTRRNISRLRTTLRWLEYYENLKQYEIDHKKSAAAYLWTVSFENERAWRLWMSLSDSDKAKTPIMQKKTPGGTLILGPGMKLEVKNPQLPRISDSDTDIMDMVSSGLNEPQDITSGRASGPFSSVKASRGPMTDRVSDEVEWLERFLRYDFWGNIFFLRSKLTKFKEKYLVPVVIGFDDKQEPMIKRVRKRPEKLIEISFPVSETDETESRARALLGVKHGSIVDTLGIPYSVVAKRLGFSNYGRLRLEKATEDLIYPELIPTVDAESVQEKREAEPSPKKVKSETVKQKEEK